MLRFANRVVFKYLTLLIFVILLSAFYIIGSNQIIDSLNQKLINYMTLVREDTSKILNISYELEKIKSNIFALSATSNRQDQRVQIKSEIKFSIDKINRKIKSMQYILDEINLKKYKLSNNFSSEYLKTLEHLKPFLENIIQENKRIDALLLLRDKYLKKNNTQIREVAFKIRRFNALVPNRMDHMMRIVQKAKSLHDINYKKLQEQIKAKKSRYQKIEIALYIIGLIVIMLIVRVVSVHIVKLYEKIENRLYLDELTGLNSRYAFINDIKNSVFPVVMIVDIDKFRSINELFGIKVGNEVLVNLAKIMVEYCDKIGYKVYRLSADEFAFHKDVKKREDVGSLENLIVGFFKYSKENKIFIKTLADTIELEFASGIAYDKENILTRADMALDYAKQNHFQYKIYSEDIDKTRSLQHNLFWKKEIQKGIETDSFIPFFQPIVDREQKVVKYESLVRLKMLKDDDISYVTPYKFLDIAIKTKYYNQISKMAIFKSLEICKEINKDITINIGKKDILNPELQKALKKRIIDLDIAHFITFEIVEREDISSDIRKLKNFIKDFKDIGVQFAIDDFGTGFSNFSFILETTPDYIKIDGSLIKNIDVDTNSYELVKSIIAFSHALNKKVIAEFVHSKEVFDIAFDLGADLFQGYYFSEPQENITAL